MRKIYGSLFGRPMNFSFIDDYLCGTARPMSRKEVEWLVQMKNVKAILSLTESPLPSSWLVNVVEYKDIPIRNHSAPTIPELKESVDFVSKNVSEGRVTAVHCAAGKGRTGTVLAAYLCASQHLSAPESIRIIRSKRSGSIEKKSGQEESILQFSNSLEAPKTG
jgi:atypical dual specificity phosphatase